jgi:glycosyltransferase involved in cell wall biosynthesis
MLVLTEFPPSIGGMQTHALYLSRYLADAGNDVQIATYHPSNQREQEAARRFDEELGIPVLRVLSRLAFWHNVEVLQQIAGRFRPDLVYCSTVFYGFLRDIVRVPVLCRSAGNDVLRPWIAYPFRFASRPLATPRFDNWVYNSFRKLEYPEPIEALFREKRHELVSLSARRMDRIIANSAFTAGLLSDLGIEEERVRVVVGGVDAERFAARVHGDGGQLRRALGIPEDRYVITTICRQVPKKGIDLLLRAFHVAQYLMPDAHLLVVGDGRHRKRYQRLATELGVGERVTFAGSVAHEDIPHYYWLSDLFVLASRVQVDPATGVRDAETMGRVLCEANAAGVPVVAARSGGIPSVIDHEGNGLLFEPDDEQDLIAQIQRIRAETALTQRMVQTGLRQAQQQFDWSAVLRAHESAFTDVLHRHAETATRVEHA